MYSWWWVELSPETCRVKPLRRINAIVASCWIYFTISLGSVVQDFVVSLFDSSHGNRSCANCYLAKPLNNISFVRMAYYSGTFAWLLFLWQQQWFFRVLLRNNNLVWALCRCQPYKYVALHVDCPILTKFGVSLQILIKASNAKCYENPCSENQTDDLRTDGRTWRNP